MVTRQYPIQIREEFSIRAVRIFLVSSLMKFLCNVLAHTEAQNMFRTKHAENVWQQVHKEA